MYIPRWFFYVVLAAASVAMGWFAQNTALAAVVGVGSAPASPASPALPTFPSTLAGVGGDASPEEVAGSAQLLDVAAPMSSADPAPVPAAASPEAAIAVPRTVGGQPTPAAAELPLDVPWYHLINPLALIALDRTVDIAGFEDHSINLSGRRQFVVYDDSNLFVNRDGKINSNTGDTDSAGLNAVDTLRSTVSSGPHCDDGCDDESIISAEHGHFDEADGGDDDDEDDEEAEDDDEGEESDRRLPSGVPAAVLRTSRLASATDARETREEADSGEEPLFPIAPGGMEIGGDGWDDVSVRLNGEDNVIVYDDSNVVFGGRGLVNAQIGDSDTGGTVTMGTVDSTVRGGISR